MSSEPYKQDDQKKAIEIRWEERRMFFWTVQQILLCVLLTALTVFVLASLVEGEPPGADLLLRYLSG